jgi:hypothetical protein
MAEASIMSVDPPKTRVSDMTNEMIGIIMRFRQKLWKPSGQCGPFLKRRLYLAEMTGKSLGQKTGGNKVHPAAKSHSRSGRPVQKSFPRQHGRSFNDAFKTEANHQQSYCI